MKKRIIFIICFSGLLLYKGHAQYRVWTEPISMAYSSISSSYPGITGSIQIGWRYDTGFSSSFGYRFSYSEKKIDYGKEIVWAKSTLFFIYANPLGENPIHQVALGVGLGISSYKYSSPTYIYHDPFTGFNPCFAIEYKYAVLKNMYVGFHLRIYGEGDREFTPATGLSLGIMSINKTSKTRE